MSDLEDWQNSMNKYFPNNLHMVFQIHEWVKDPFKMQDRLMNFNITKHAKLNDGFTFHNQAHLQETITCIVLVEEQRRFQKPIRIFLPFPTTSLYKANFLQTFFNQNNISADCMQELI